MLSFKFRELSFSHNNSNSNATAALIATRRLSHNLNVSHSFVRFRRSFLAPFHLITKCGLHNQPLWRVQNCNQHLPRLIYLLLIAYSFIAASSFPPSIVYRISVATFLSHIPQIRQIVCKLMRASFRFSCARKRATI